ncbi:MAG TPA: DMT family transporter [Candidatus Coprenecus pullicola]|nr:DMT family transporter [Candidatus Coprenecus pullicola]
MKNKTGGIVLAAVSSLTFGFVPFFSVTLMDAGFSPFEVLAYRWGVATLILLAVGILMHKSFRIPKGAWLPLLAVSFFCALTAISLLIAYENIASGVASTIHFMYPLFVAAVMMLVFREPRSWVKIGAVILSLVGAGCLVGGDIRLEGGNVTAGVLWAAISVIAYGTYIIGVRKTRVREMSTLPLTVCVMGFGAVSFTILGMLFGGVRWVPFSDGFLWANILGIALLGTAVSNITLVAAIKRIGPTLSAILGALEPLTAVVIGVLALSEAFTLRTAAGIVLIIAAVTAVVLSEGRHKGRQ